MLWCTRKGTSGKTSARIEIPIASFVCWSTTPKDSRFKVHFYSRQRAKDALSYIQNTPNQFSNATLVHHKKEVGVRQDEEAKDFGMEESKWRGRKRAPAEEDDDGFTTVGRGGGGTF